MNLVLGDVLETIYVVDEEDDDEEIKVGMTLLLFLLVQMLMLLFKTITKKSEMLFVRGKLRCHGADEKK
jgi:hypothetical protein